MISKVSVPGVTFDWEIPGQEEAFRLYRAHVEGPIVKEAPSEPHNLDTGQKRCLKELNRGFHAFDPSANPFALQAWRHLLQPVNVRLLKQTHDTVATTFKNGSHKGQSVMQLAERLPRGCLSKQRPVQSRLEVEAHPPQDQVQLQVEAAPIQETSHA